MVDIPRMICMYVRVCKNLTMNVNFPQLSNSFSFVILIALTPVGCYSSENVKNVYFCNRIPSFILQYIGMICT